MKQFSVFSLLLFFLTISNLPEIGLGQGSASQSFREIREVVSNWSPRQHVWIAGNIPVAQSLTSALEKWIESNAPNWTVVLMENARGQQYGPYRGMDAVEQALGKGLSNETGFGQLIHPQTREPNGAVFVLFLQERKFSYFASDAYDKRSLGEDHWIGRLDREAIRAMRSGGRIIDAVKQTISSIDGQLSRSLQRETAAAARQAEQARQIPVRLGQRIDAAKVRAANLRNYHPEFRGPLAFPHLDNWLADLAAVKTHLQNGHHSKTIETAGGVLKEIDQYESNLQEWEEDAGEILDLEKRLQSSGQGRFDSPLLDGFRSQTKASVAAAKANHRRGDPVYLDQVSAARRSFAKLDGEAARLRANEEAAKARVVRNWLIGGGLSLLLFIWLLFLNRNRREARDHALGLHREWKQKLRGKFDRLFQLMDRASVLQRNSDNYEGETKAMTSQAVREVDELFIMSSATDRVMEQAKGLVDPFNPISRIFNKFSRQPFRKATALMESKAVGFEGRSGLREIIARGKSKNRQLLGDEKDYEPFSISFKQLIEAYDSKERAAARKIERLEKAVDGLPLSLEKGESLLARFAERLAKLNQATTADQFFPLSHLQSKLLPEAEKQLKQASANSAADPVSAFEGPAASAMNLLDFGESLLSQVESIRSTVFPGIRQAAGRLEAMNLPAVWVDEAYREHSEKAERLSALALERPVSKEELEEWKDDLIRTQGTVNGAANLAKQLKTRVEKQIDDKENEIRLAREKLGAQLGLTPDHLLREDDLDPSQRVETTRHLLSMARHALGRGKIESAQTEVQHIEELLGEADDIMVLSQEIADEGESFAADIEQQIEESENQMPEAEALLKQMSAAYPAEVLLFEERFGEDSSGQKSIAGSADLAVRHLSGAKQCVSRAKELHCAGQLVSAGGLLERAANEAGFASHQIALIKDQHRALKRTITENRKDHTNLLDRYRSSISKAADTRTRQPTIEQEKKLGERLREIGAALQIASGNPFRLKRKLRDADAALDSLEEAIEIDWEWHATANRELAGAKNLLSSIDQLISQAKGDGIPDSAKLKRSFRDVFHLNQDLLDWQVYLSASHRDWEKAHHGIVSIESQASKIKGVIEEEIKLANRAARSLREASHAITDLKNWRGGYGVSADRQAGDAGFGAARRALSNGDYEEAVSQAAISIRDAQSALMRAKALQRRIQAEEEAARRRRAAAAAARAASRSRTPSWSSSRSSISIGGSSSSSSGSSGSGFSRSGW